MVGALVGTAAAAAAAVVALAGHLGATTPADGASSPFGGSVPVHIGQVGHIEVDLEAPASSSGLRRVRCATVSQTVTCFVGR